MPLNPAARRQSLVVLVALTAAFLFGAFDQWIGGRYNLFWTQVSIGLSALWLVVPFIAGFLMLNQLSFGLLGHTLSSQGQWFAFAVVAGPVFGLLGYRWRTFQYWAYALPVALALVLEPPARWTLSRIGLGDIPYVPFRWPNDGLAQRAEFVEFVLGLVATSLILCFGAQRRKTEADPKKWTPWG